MEDMINKLVSIVKPNSDVNEFFIAVMNCSACASGFRGAGTTTKHSSHKITVY